jgi:hypothetical protein
VAHSSDFCFQSDKWHTVFPPENHIQLVTPFRQKDPEYSAILDEVRRGELSEHGIGALRLRVREYVDDGGIAPTQLYAIRVKTDFVNNKMYGALKTAEIVCETVPNANARLYIENGEPLEPSVLDACLSLTEDDRKFYFEMLHTNSNTTKRMALKIGAVVMCTVNLNLEMGICNGSQGVVEEFVKDLTNRSVPMVRFNNGVRMQIGYHKVQSHDYPTLTLEYMPLVLAWALTIHKIQGSTLDRAIMDLGTTVFEYGQTYVALSRVRSIDGLYLKAFVPQRIKSNPLVKEFYSKIPALPIEVTHESMEEVEEMVVNLSLAPSVPVPPAPPVPGPTLAPLVPTAHSVMPKAPSSVIPSRFSAFAYNAPPIQVTKLPEEAPAPLVEEPPKAEEPTSSGSTECSICLTNKKNVLYMPCNHICVCNACDEQLARDMIVKEKKYRMCPLCRKKIVSKMNVFV